MLPLGIKSRSSFKRFSTCRLVFFYYEDAEKCKSVVQMQFPMYVFSTAVQRKTPGRVDERKKGVRTKNG